MYQGFSANMRHSFAAELYHPSFAVRACFGFIRLFGMGVFVTAAQVGGLAFYDSMSSERITPLLARDRG